MKTVRLVLYVLACMAAVGLLLFRSGPDPDAVPSVDEVSGRLMSPFCEGLTLEECPSDRSTRLRGQIAGMIAAGSTNRQIDAWMQDNYGVVSLGRPNSAPAWIAPPLMGAAGLVTVLLILRRRRSPEHAEQTPTAVLSNDDEATFARDFSRFSRGTE